jgi:hypothetical protein
MEKKLNFMDFEKAYDSFRREIPYNIVTEFGIHMKLITPIKMFKWNL